jgi:hypothetical protein
MACKSKSTGINKCLFCALTSVFFVYLQCRSFLCVSQIPAKRNPCSVSKEFFLFRPWCADWNLRIFIRLSCCDFWLSLHIYGVEIVCVPQRCVDLRHMFCVSFWVRSWKRSKDPTTSWMFAAGRRRSCIPTTIIPLAWSIKVYSGSSMCCSLFSFPHKPYPKS